MIRPENKNIFSRGFRLIYEKMKILDRNKTCACIYSSKLFLEPMHFSSHSNSSPRNENLVFQELTIPVLTKNLPEIEGRKRNVSSIIICRTRSHSSLSD
jgi:hypothetical protein